MLRRLLLRRILLEHFFHRLLCLLFIAFLRVRNAVHGRLSAPHEMFLRHIVQINRQYSHGARLFSSDRRIREVASLPTAPSPPTSPYSPRAAAPTPAGSKSIIGCDCVQHFLSLEMKGNVNVGLLVS